MEFEFKLAFRVAPWSRGEEDGSVVVVPVEPEYGWVWAGALIVDEEFAPPGAAAPPPFSKSHATF